MPDVTVNPPATACALGGNVAAGLTLELHLLKSGNVYQVGHEWTDIKEGSGHGGQRVRQTNWAAQSGSTSPCAPTPEEGQTLVSFSGWLPSPGYHNGSWTIKARYGWSTFTPPYNYGGPYYAEISITVTFDNLLMQTEAGNPVVLAWDPDDPAKRQTRVQANLTDAQRSPGAVQLEVYELSDHSLVKTVEVPVTVPGAATMEWDGTNDMGFVMPRGMYGYNLLAWDTVSGSGGDMDVKTSNYLFIDCATDEQGNPITEAEYAGYDDNGTPEDETDDNHLYYIKHYKLREAPVPKNDDGDGWENEDWEDGVDNDGDGAVDENPVNSEPLRNASEGWIRLYDPDLQNVKG